MKKVLLHYFSGTGNSLLVAKQLSIELTKYELEVVFHSIEDNLNDNYDIYHFHIFFFPIYATAVPHIMLKYINNLPDGKNSKVAVISTNGTINTLFRDGYQGWALHQVRLHLKHKNYKVFLTDTLDYPHNITIAMPPRKDKYNEKIIAKASEKIPLIAEKIARSQKSHRSIFIPNILWSVPFGILFSVFGRRFIGKMFVADSCCNSCGHCVNNCPAKTIKAKQGKIKWGFNCEGCLRCINSCPNHAIQASGFRVIVILLATYVYLFSIIHGVLIIEGVTKLGKTNSTILCILLNSTLFLILCLFLDWVMFKFLHIPVINKVINFGLTNLWGRYSAQKFEKQFLNIDKEINNTNFSRINRSKSKEDDIWS